MAISNQMQATLQNMHRTAVIRSIVEKFLSLDLGHPTRIGVSGITSSGKRRGKSCTYCRRRSQKRFVNLPSNSFSLGPTAGARAQRA